MKVIPRTLSVLWILGTTVSLIHSQADKNTVPAENKTEPKTESARKAKEPLEGQKKEGQLKLKSVDLCALAQEMSLTKEEAAKETRRWMEMKIQDRTGKTRNKGMPEHSDITLSVKQKDKVRFFCAKEYQLRIDRFEKATATGCAATIDPGAPPSPFGPSVTFPTAKQTQIVLGPAVAAAIPQRCYKFSFTVWMTADPSGTHVDPHLIVTP